MTISIEEMRSFAAVAAQGTFSAAARALGRSQSVVSTHIAGMENELGRMIGSLLAVVENYPDLKANQNFLELQSQLEGTENRINVARKDFNDAAKEYNVAIRRFPKSLIAGMCGFDKKNYFEAEAGADKAPKVEF